MRLKVTVILGVVRLWVNVWSDTGDETIAPINATLVGFDPQGRVRPILGLFCRCFLGDRAPTAHAHSPAVVQESDARCSNSTRSSFFLWHCGNT